MYLFKKDSAKSMKNYHNDKLHRKCECNKLIYLIKKQCTSIIIRGLNGFV